MSNSVCTVSGLYSEIMATDMGKPACKFLQNMSNDPQSTCATFQQDYLNNPDWKSRDCATDLYNQCVAGNYEALQNQAQDASNQFCQQ